MWYMFVECTTWLIQIEFLRVMVMLAQSNTSKHYQ